jgi:peptide subunit release factor 1 (eRF1)
LRSSSTLTPAPILKPQPPHAQLIKGLEAARGNGTSMISLIMPPKDQVSCDTVTARRRRSRDRRSRARNRYRC